ncbi:hypothetical protein RB195_019992 [Necator americanus]|uniref:Reverse transcriptase domain-containing protein n=1 Tax=Necator americanus TaxID=51031 RepID=A0ABR1CI75_NECAM
MSMRSHRVPEEYVQWTKLLYAKPASVVRCAAGTSRPSPVQVGVHQGSSLSSLLFILCMDTITKEIQKQTVDSTLSDDSCSRRSLEMISRNKYSLGRISAAIGLRLNISKTNTWSATKEEDGSIRVMAPNKQGELFQVPWIKVTSTGDIDQEGRARLMRMDEMKNGNRGTCDKEVPVLRSRNLRGWRPLPFTDASAGRQRKPWKSVTR